MTTIDTKLTLRDRLSHAWNMFKDPNMYQVGYYPSKDLGRSYGRRPDKITSYTGMQKSIVASMFNRIAIDISSITVKQVKLDENQNYLEDSKAVLNNTLLVSPNIDQTPSAFLQDLVISLFDEGHIAIVPVVTSFNPLETDSYQIESLRIAQIIEWFPKHVRVWIYNETIGEKVQLIIPKTVCAIVENPLSSIMNEPGSTGQNLVNKLNQLDAINEQSASGKLDLIIQLPYVIRSESKKEQAEQRRLAIEEQLKGSKYGIAYADGTERITQLNRPAENNIMSQVEYLTKMLYNQLCLTEEIMNGTASEDVMKNYYVRVCYPVLRAICESMTRTFLTKTARTQGQSIKWFNSPFNLVSSEGLAVMADKFTRNEIMSSNEFRQVIGLKPSSNPRANELLNKNIKPSEPAPEKKVEEPTPIQNEGEIDE